MTFADLAAAATKDKDFAKESAKAPAVAHEEDDGGEDDEGVDVEAAPDVHFTPIVKLEAVETKTLEENETEMFKMRAKMFRFERDSNEWKERGTGEVKLLQDPKTCKVRLVMRRDQTLKVCANHMVAPEITLRPNVGSDRSWVYSVLADVSDGEPRAELFAIRFANPENASAFKAKFEECQRTSKEDNRESKDPKAEAGSGRSSADAKSDKDTTSTEEEEASKEPADDVKRVQESLESVTIDESKEQKN